MILLNNFLALSDCLPCQGKPLASSFSIGKVFLGGLGAGINPCAIAAILMLLGMLVIFTNRPQKILSIGLTYVFTIFIIFFSFGFGFYQSLLYFRPTLFYQTINKAFLIILGLFFISFGIFKLSGLKLNFKKITGFKNVIWLKLIQKSTIPATAILALLVAILGLPCSWTIYFGTVFILPNDLSFINLSLYLLLFNFFLILPSLFVLFLVYWGNKHGKSINILKEWQEKNQKSLHKIAGAILLLLGTLILISLIIS